MIPYLLQGVKFVFLGESHHIIFKELLHLVMFYHFIKARVVQIMAFTERSKGGGFRNNYSDNMILEGVSIDKDHLNIGTLLIHPFQLL
mmetsp:Transcript_4333/g.4102  ORF Transcript_4333/g.4102 Transcript_4333/m.4102 type:complete len:88 (-) Transcript_4333:1627-1890(-)